MASPLRVGDPVPPFEARDAEGTVWTEKDLLGRPCVLFFYPRDQTPGCTVEAQAFRDAWPELGRLGVRVLGVSRDDAGSHRAFAEKECLPFPLLSDRDGRMVEAFGATMLGGLPRRVSYLVDAEGRVAAAFRSHFRPAAHAERMLEAARRLAPAERAHTRRP